MGVSHCVRWDRYTQALPCPATRGRPSPGLHFYLMAPMSRAGPSPTVHPIQSPQNRFCVLTLDPETLPAIATTLIDVLFYSHRWAMHTLDLWPH